jgi:hypothetical protein
MRKPKRDPWNPPAYAVCAAIVGFDSVMPAAFTSGLMRDTWAVIAAVSALIVGTAYALSRR